MAEHSSSAPVPAVVVFPLARAAEEPAQAVHMTRYMFLRPPYGHRRMAWTTPSPSPSQPSKGSSRGYPNTDSSRHRPCTRHKGKGTPSHHRNS
ncbi:hypothetical protein, partial [Acetobacter sp.]|uniref:hypothetical protein n=1 Tax=Acetobacter sp. TaxID=440 RepID=UPI0039EB8441